MIEKKTLIDVHELARMVRLSPGTIYNWIAPSAKKPCPFVPIRKGRRVFFDKNQVFSYLESIMQGGADYNLQAKRKKDGEIPGQNVPGESETRGGQTGAVYSANSYLYLDYNLSSVLHSIPIHTSVDKIVLTGIDPDIDAINSCMEISFKTIEDKDITKGPYKRIRSYENVNGKVSFLYKPKHTPKFIKPQSMLIIFQPNARLIKQIWRVIRQTNSSPNFHTLELPVDFYVEDAFGFQNFLIRHLLLKRSKTPPGFKENTYYTNNIRKSSKGIRVYPRPKGAVLHSHVRMELELHKSILRKALKLSFPIDPALFENVFDYTKYFEFMTWRQDKLVDCFARRGMRSAKMEVKLKSPKGSVAKAHSRGLIGEILNKPMMHAIHRLREPLIYQFSGITRFLEPHAALNQVVGDKIREQLFGIRELAKYV